MTATTKKWRIATITEDGEETFEVYKLKDPLKEDTPENRQIMADYKDPVLAHIVCDQMNENLGGTS